MSHHVAIVGGSLTGNKGAASMVLAVTDGVRERDPDARVTVLTPLFDEDQSEGPHEDVAVVAYGPVAIILTVLASLICRLSFGRIALTPALKALRDADGVADVSGISFVDGRGIVTLAYNVLLVLPALVLGRPVVKVSQAMGPFRQPMTRLAARLILPRMSGLLARGAQTQQHLHNVGVRSDGQAGDVAFLMSTSDADADWAENVAPETFVAVAASYVVAEQARPLGIDYTTHVVEVVDRLTEMHDVILIPHSARPGKPAGRLNDVPLCLEVRERAAHRDRVRVAPSDASPRQLRALIGRAEILITSRFHAMISGLATTTPVVVIGWSHKYREVLAEFGCAELAIDFRDVDPDTTADAAADLLAHRDDASAALRARLPTVLASAGRNLEVLASSIPRSTT